MRKQLRKIALAVVFTMAVSMLAPAQQVAFAAAKIFTYAEQKTGDKVTSLFMERGEKVDLKFMGISDYKNYKLKWVSSNEKVAVVDSNGVITALANGTTTIKLNVGDGKNYSSMGVIVHVGKAQEVTIGTAAKDEIKSYTLEMGKSVMLKANGLEDNVGGRYTCTWSSTDTSVARISTAGLVTTVAPGLAVIQLSVKKTATNEVITAPPIALHVTAAGGASTPVATATPTPTRIPWATATPTPRPTATATPTPLPVVETGSYSVTVTSDKTITLTFPQAASYTVDDLELSMILEADNNDILVKQDLSSVESANDGKQLIVTTVSNLTTGRYNIKVGSETQGRTFPVSIGVPNRLDIVYTCLGRTNTAYAYDDEVGLDVPVNLEYKLYYGNIDVTASYTDSGYMEYEMVSPTNSDDVSLEGEQIYFYAPKKTAVIRGTFKYYTESGNVKELKDSVSIISKEIGDYTITHVANWTIIDTTENKAIDWDNPVRKVVADKDNFKIVALLADSYGYYYSTDDLGVDKSKNIYSVNDDETLFALKGYTYAFNTSNDDYFYIDDNGDLYTYKARQNAAAYITLYNSDEWASGERNVGAWQFTILAESKLNKVEIEESSVMLLTEALDGFEERFCEAEIPVKLYDQYNYEWDGDAYLDVSSTTSSVNDSIETVASVEKDENGEWMLHIDGKTLYTLSKKKSSVSLVVTDSETKKKDSITVQMKSPVTKNKDTIEVDDWAVGMKEATITFGDGNLSEVSAKAEIEIYQVSKTGNYNVGLVTNGNVDENDNVNVIKRQTKKDPGTSFWSSCTPGEIYVLVLGPDNKIVEEADSSTDLGVWIDKTTGKVTVNLTSSDGNNLTCMEEGTYTVKITRVNKSNGSKLMKPTSFTVVDNTKDVTFAGLKGARTEEDISNEDDAKQVIVELMNFRLGDTAWTTLTENMITKVNYEPRGNNKIYITSIEFAVPADGKSESGVVTYKKTVNIRKSITFGVDD